MAPMPSAVMERLAAGYTLHRLWEADVAGPLHRLPDVVLSQRASWTTRAATDDLVLANIGAYFAGRPLPTPVV